MRFVIKQHVRKPVQEVFGITSNFDYVLPEIDPDVVSVTRSPAGPVGKGTKWVETLKGPGMKLVMDAEFTRFDSPNSLDFSMKGTGMRGAGTMTCKANGEGTDLEFDIHATTSGVGWLFYPLIRWDIPRRERRRLARLAELIESSTLTRLGADKLAGA